MATITWKGYTWDLTDGAAGIGAGYGAYAAANVTGPDGSDHVTINITNPTGSAPIGCEMTNQTRGLGYGTYILTISTALNTLDDNIVFGGLFLLNYGCPYVEIDVGEVSAWNSGASPVVDSTNWYGPDQDDIFSTADDASTLNIDSGATHTFRLIWMRNYMQIEVFVGTDLTVAPYKKTIYTKNIPLPSQEAATINIWLFTNNTPPIASDLDAPATAVVLTNFQFIAAPIEQEGFEFRNDDGSESTATSVAAQDTQISRSKNTNTRVRAVVNPSSQTAPYKYQLECRKKGSGNAWQKIN